jgi:hypothetical protein
MREEGDLLRSFGSTVSHAANGVDELFEGLVAVAVASIECAAAIRRVPAHGVTV